MNTEEEQYQHRSTTHLKIGIGFLYSFALLYSLGPFFAWVLMGGAFYGFILFFYYKRLANPKPEESQGEWSNSKSSPNQPISQQISITKIFRFLPLIIGGITILTITIVIISSGNNSTEGEQTISSSDDSNLSEQIKKTPTDAEGYVELGNEFYNNGEHDSAQYYYKKALNMKPGFREAQYNIALDYYSQQKYTEAILAIDACLQQHTDYGEAWQLKGDCTYYLEKEEEALGYYEQSYTLGTRNAFLSHMLAYLYDVKENTNKAIGFYKEAIQLDSSKVEIYKRLAELEPEKADWYLQKAKDWSK